MPPSPVPNVSWSDQVNEATWIADRLVPPEEAVVGSWVPNGYAAYGRILHPVHTDDQEAVRWSAVAEWSGRSLGPSSEFHSVAFPVEETDRPAPWSDQGPNQGSLDAGDAAALVAVLERHTSTPGRCWFCIWEGYGWGEGARILYSSDSLSAGEVAVSPPDPVPVQVREGPRVSLPWRDYFLYSGAVGDALAFVESESQTPNLFWPSDRSWCVASEIDLTSTYIGGSEELIGQLLLSSDVEALPVQPTDSLVRVEPWIEELVASAIETLLADGKATIKTTRGTVWAQLERSGIGGRHLMLATTHVSSGNARGSGGVNLGGGTSDDLRRQMAFHLTSDVIGLVE